ncbi:MAG: cytochrome-c peroxidase, partial [Anderseniella sp.]
MARVPTGHNRFRSGGVLLASITVLLGISGPPAVADDFGPVKPLEVKRELADLGKRLFYDERLSGDTSLSCASCHQPDKAFTDGKALSDAYT